MIQAITNIVEIILTGLVIAVLLYPYAEYVSDKHTTAGMFAYIGEAYYGVLYNVTHHHIVEFLAVIVILFFLAACFHTTALILAIWVFQIAIAVHCVSIDGYHPMTNQL